MKKKKQPADPKVRTQIGFVRDTAASHKLYEVMLRVVRAKKAEREREEAELKQAEGEQKKQ